MEGDVCGAKDRIILCGIQHSFELCQVLAVQGLQLLGKAIDMGDIVIPIDMGNEGRCPAVQAAEASLSPVSRADGGQRRIHRRRLSRKRQQDGFIVIIGRGVEMVSGDFQQDGIPRCLDRQIHVLIRFHQLGVLYHIAAAGKDAAFTLTHFPPDFFKVQQLKQFIRETVNLRDKAVLSIESAEGGIIFCLRHYMAAVRTVSEINQARDTKRLPLLDFHVYKPIERRSLYLVQFRELLCQCVEFAQVSFTNHEW